MSRAYLRTFDDNLWLVSGIQYMPITIEQDAFVKNVLSITGASLFPLALSLLLPIFMHSIVSEKEEKLLEIMRMNGMKMTPYWAATLTF